MDCVPVTAVTGNSTNSSGGGDYDYDYLDYNYTIDEGFIEDLHWYQHTESIIDRYVTHYICLLGIVGNLITLVVLSRKTLTAHMGRLEKSSHMGLMALAVSDLLYCVCNLPQALQDRTLFSSASLGFWLVYSAYGSACINCFLVSSTWLTVAMAVCRYLAICHPLHARQYLGMTSSRAIISLVFALSLVFNLPRFWMKQVTWVECVGGGRSYFTMGGLLSPATPWHMTYMWLFFTFAILLPLALLTYCNVYLVKAISSSNALRRQHQATARQGRAGGSTEATRIVTLTLCVIVLMYIVLVAPAELVAFWQPFVKENALQYGLAVRICNALQMLNFAVNFILYCIINVHFRKVVRDMLLCHYIRATPQPAHKLGDRDFSTQETSLMMTDTDHKRCDSV